MTRRTLSSLLACGLLLVLVVAMAFLPVPYVTMSPGPTVDVLGDTKGEPIIEVSGHRTFPTDGDLRLTTVSVTGPQQRLSLVAAMAAWFDGSRAVYPRDAIYEPDKTADDVETESSVAMVSSQDNAIAAALTELGYDVPVTTEILAVTKGSAAQGKLRVRDRVVSVNGQQVTSTAQVSRIIQRSGVGGDAEFVVRRAGALQRVTVTARASDDDPKKAVVGVVVGPGYEFPFEVAVNLSEDIGGPSAGLIFSLAVYDKLTPGALTAGVDVAGTGTIAEDGSVGPIGGIAQKIVAAADAGAELFLVPPDNCDSALGADVSEDEIRLVRAPTMHSAVESLQAYARNKSADLPRCR